MGNKGKTPWDYQRVLKILLLILLISIINYKALFLLSTLIIPKLEIKIKIDLKEIIAFLKRGK